MLMKETQVSQMNLHAWPIPFFDRGKCVDMVSRLHFVGSLSHQREKTVFDAGVPLVVPCHSLTVPPLLSSHNLKEINSSDPLSFVLLIKP